MTGLEEASSVADPSDDIGPHRPLSAVFHTIAEQPGETIALGELMALSGSRTHGVAIFVLALPEALPLPIPSIGVFLGVPLIALCAHLALFGERTALPPGTAGWSVPLRLIHSVERRVAPMLKRLERHSGNRWTRLAGRERLVGFVCLALSVLLILPIPFFNVPPALCLILLAWGLVQRDGVFVLAGLAGSVVVFAGLAWGGHEIADWWRERV